MKYCIYHVTKVLTGLEFKKESKACVRQRMQENSYHSNVVENSLFKHGIKGEPWFAPVTCCSELAVHGKSHFF